MSASDWAAILEGVFLDRNAVPVAQATKRAIKRAAKHSSASKSSLKASLQSYLEQHSSAFVTDGEQLVRVAKAPAVVEEGTVELEQPPPRKKQKKAKGTDGVAVPGGAWQDSKQAEHHEQQPEPAVKKQKHAKQVGGEAASERLSPAEAQGQAARSSQKEKRKKGKEHAEPDSVVMRPAAAGQAPQAPPVREQEGQNGAAGSKKRKHQALEQAGAAADWTGGQEGQAGSKSAHKKKQKETQLLKAGSGEAAGTGRELASPPPEASSPGTAQAGDESVAWRESDKRRDVKGGLYSKEEKETLRAAFKQYAEDNGLSSDDYSWVFDKGGDAAKRGMWAKIAAVLPHRTVKSVWNAATRMFHEGNYQGRWSAEEDKRLLELVADKGRQWKEIGGVLGRMPQACLHRYREVQLGDRRRSGRWAQDEEERLEEAVKAQLDARGAAGEWQGEERSRRELLDNVNWALVSQHVGTRTHIQCLEKWYDQLSPSMVTRGDWGEGDDRRLLRTVYATCLAGASQEFEVDWANVVAGRTGQQSRRRWRLMVKAVPDHRDLQFLDVVDRLVDAHMPHLKDQAVKQQQQQQTAERNNGTQEGKEDTD